MRASQEYAKGFVALLEQHFHEAVLDALPPRYNSLLQSTELLPADQHDMIPQPQLDRRASSARLPIPLPLVCRLYSAYDPVGSLLRSLGFPSESAL